jgi:hypothetical protein
MSDEKKEQEVEQSDIQPIRPEGSYQDAEGVWRDRDGNPIGGGSPEE